MKLVRVSQLPAPLAVAVVAADCVAGGIATARRVRAGCIWLCQTQRIFGFSTVNPAALR